MKFILVLLIAFTVGCSSTADNNIQTAGFVVKDTLSIKEFTFQELSNNYNYHLVFYQKIKQKNTEEYYCVIKILDKKSHNVIDSIKQNLSTLLLVDTTVDSRSYITGENANKNVQDNFYGTLVVADFNFDKKEDFAIMNDVGASTGGIYTYYTQTNNKFMVDTFLSHTMVFFPAKIDTVNNELTTYVHANAYEMGENKYWLNKQTSKWEVKSHKFLPYKKH